MSDRSGKRIAKSRGFIEVFLAALRLGITSFGGPIAHIGYFREEYVNRKKWLDESAFAELTALCQFLPGPASSQLGMAIGMKRSGLTGALAAWLGFTLPSAVAMLLFALWVDADGGLMQSGWLHGLMLVAVAVVAQAVWNMSRTLAPDRTRAAMALAAACAAVLIPGMAGQLLPLLLCAAIGLILFRRIGFNAGSTPAAIRPLSSSVQRLAANIFLLLFVILIFLLPAAAKMYPSSAAAALADSTYRAGSLVFGGGHVILPMLQQEVVHPGPHGLSADTFMAGYGAAQAIPGPLFTFSAYIGGSLASGWQGVLLGVLALLFIFLPSFLLLAGAMPYWDALRHNTAVRAALTGVNAGVVGILLAALYQPVWTGSVRTPLDFAFVLAAFAILHIWKLKPWQVVLLAATAGFFLWS